MQVRSNNAATQPPVYGDDGSWDYNTNPLIFELTDFDCNNGTKWFKTDKTCPLVIRTNAAGGYSGWFGICCAQDGTRFGDSHVRFTTFANRIKENASSLLGNNGLYGISTHSDAFMWSNFNYDNYRCVEIKNLDESLNTIKSTGFIGKRLSADLGMKGFRVSDISNKLEIVPVGLVNNTLKRSGMNDTYFMYFNEGIAHGYGGSGQPNIVNTGREMLNSGISSRYSGWLNTTSTFNGGNLIDEVFRYAGGSMRYYNTPISNSNTVRANRGRPYGMGANRAFVASFKYNNAMIRFKVDMPVSFMCDSDPRKTQARSFAWPGATVVLPIFNVVGSNNDIVIDVDHNIEISIPYLGMPRFTSNDAANPLRVLLTLLNVVGTNNRIVINVNASIKYGFNKNNRVATYGNVDSSNFAYVGAITTVGGASANNILIIDKMNNGRRNFYSNLRETMAGTNGLCGDCVGRLPTKDIVLKYAETSTKNDSVPAFNSVSNW